VNLGRDDDSKDQYQILVYDTSRCNLSREQHMMVVRGRTGGC